MLISRFTHILVLVFVGSYLFSSSSKEKTTAIMDDEELAVTGFFYLTLASTFIFKRPLRLHRFWEGADLGWSQRLRFSEHLNLLQNDYRNFHEDKFFKYYRMTPRRFDELLEILEGRLTKQTTNYREPISPSERLGITLRFLATGDFFFTIGGNFRVGEKTVRKIVYETSTILWDELKPIYMPDPNQEFWRKTAEAYYRRWQFPNCLGSVDGKQVGVRKFHNSGSNYYNYKNFCSVVLMGVSDAFYRFIYIDVGACGSMADSSVFRDCSLGQLLDKNMLNIPGEKNLPGTNSKQPHVLIGDEGFPLKPYLLRPFPRSRLTFDFLGYYRAIFNYRLSRARRIIENAFGILVARWQVLARPIRSNEAHTRVIIQACVILHNFLISRDLEENNRDTYLYCPTGFADSRDNDNGIWRTIIPEYQSVSMASSNFKRCAEKIRDAFVMYFNGAGAVPWQDSRVSRQRPL